MGIDGESFKQTAELAAEAVSVTLIRLHLPRGPSWYPQVTDLVDAP